MGKDIKRAKNADELAAAFDGVAAAVAREEQAKQEQRRKKAGQS